MPDEKKRVKISGVFSKMTPGGNVYSDEALRKMAENFKPGVPIFLGQDGEKVGEVSEIKISDGNVSMTINLDDFEILPRMCGENLISFGLIPKPKGGD